MKKYLISSIIILSAVLSFAFYRQANANPSYVPSVLPTATATTTRTYLAAGTATSTYSFDSYGSGITNLTDKASLLIQFTASSSLAVLGWRYEYADTTTGQDCTSTGANCDWYGNSFDYSTTTTSVGLSDLRDASPFAENRWVYASTTVGTSATTTAKKIVSVSTPTRYVRVVFYVPIGASPAAVWAKWIPRKELK